MVIKMFKTCKLYLSDECLNKPVNEILIINVWKNIMPCRMENIKYEI